MDKYQKLDELILGRIRESASPVRFAGMGTPVRNEAWRLMDDWGVTADRIIDRRLQVLRKAGKIRVERQGWVLVVKSPC